MKKSEAILIGIVDCQRKVQVDPKVVDTTLQEKEIAHPADARLNYRAIEKQDNRTKSEGVAMRQGYLQLAKRAAIIATAHFCWNVTLYSGRRK